MANMIIKPAADGNLLIQDRAGGAVLSTAASGATIANATITAPTIASMANCTFPVGHVIQTTTAVTATTDTIATSFSDYGDTVITGSITPAGSSNSILMFANFTVYINNTSGDTGYTLKMKKVHSGGTSYPDTMHEFTGSTAYSTHYHNTGTGDFQVPHSNTWQDNAGGVAGSAITYTLQIKPYSINGNCTIGSPDAGRWSLFFMEVQR